jgi:hypothetical protein
MLLGLLCVVVILAGCNSAAAQRLKDASRIIASRIGASADDIERSFQTRFTTLTEVQLADEAEATARRTTWLDAAVAKLAANRVKTAKAVQRSTCTLIDDYDVLVQLGAADQDAAIREIIVDKLREQGLSDDEKAVEDLWAAITTQIDSLHARGSFDLQSMSSDLFCLFEL